MIYGVRKFIAEEWPYLIIFLIGLFIIGMMILVVNAIFEVHPKPAISSNKWYASSLLIFVHDPSEPYADWYNALTMPDSTVSCCHKDHDCGPTDYRMGQGGYEVPIDGKWLPVPPERVLRKNNPTGQGVLCGRRGASNYIFYCFVPSNGV